MRAHFLVGAAILMTLHEFSYEFYKTIEPDFLKIRPLQAEILGGHSGINALFSTPGIFRVNNCFNRLFLLSLNIKKYVRILLNTTLEEVFQSKIIGFKIQLCKNVLLQKWTF